ncbi:MAG TPA: methyltransferase domain-containing protein [Acidobacteriaceae bacterium]
MSTLADLCVCPHCRNSLDRSPTVWTCTGCGRQYPVTEGFVNFAPEIRHQGGLGQLGMEIGFLVRFYETVWRPAFVRSMGRNWNRALTPELEDAYLLDHVKPAGGPVLDLACGAGRWTRTLVQRFGADSVIGFDLSFASLRACRVANPDAPLIRGNAWSLPFADGTFGAINCSNSLQLIPDTPRVLHEVGRTLRPGGTFTCFTFRRSPSNTYRLLQGTVERVMTVRAFRLEDIELWLNAASMELIDVSGPNLALLFTARKLG